MVWWSVFLIHIEMHCGILVMKIFFGPGSFLSSWASCENWNFFFVGRKIPCINNDNIFFVLVTVTSTTKHIHTYTGNANKLVECKQSQFVLFVYNFVVGCPIHSFRGCLVGIYFWTSLDMSGQVWTSYISMMMKHRDGWMGFSSWKGSILCYVVSY